MTSLPDSTQMGLMSMIQTIEKTTELEAVLKQAGITVLAKGEEYKTLLFVFRKTPRTLQEVKSNYAQLQQDEQLRLNRIFFQNELIAQCVASFFIPADLLEQFYQA